MGEGGGGNESWKKQDCAKMKNPRIWQQDVLEMRGEEVDY